MAMALSMPKPRSCLLYVHLSMPASTRLELAQLEALLSCAVQQFWSVRVTPNPAFKVKISESDLHNTLKSGHKKGCFVALW